MSTCSPTRALAPAEGYRIWAASYDRENNPMLSLEQRILERLLPPMAGLDIVDLGCGTGRWLAASKRAGARRLVGVDLSPEMLSLAKEKLGKGAKLLCSDYVEARIQESSADIVFCNFVLSYIADAEQFLCFASKILKSGGVFFLTDVHPGTAARLSWRRGVRVKEGLNEIQTHERNLSDVIALCEQAGLEMSAHLEPRFADVERTVFKENGKGEYYETIREYPAIYVLQLRAQKKNSRTALQKREHKTGTRMLHGRLALGPADSVVAEIFIEGGHLDKIHTEGGSRSPSRSDVSVDLQDHLVFPGFINAHDHLEFALFPRMGRGGYRNFLEWAEDIHQTYATEIARQRQVPKQVRLWWGGIRNLLCGVTTVCHHNPYEAEVFENEFVVKVLRKFGWSHSLSLDPSTPYKKHATCKGQPFLLHSGEGIDATSAEEIFELHRTGVLDAETIIIHGVGMGEEGKDLLRKVGAGLVWCPSSNLFLFGNTIAAEEIRSFANVALGSDSPLTANGDLLDEVCCAYKELNANPADLYDHITIQAAKLLRLRSGEGSLRIGSSGDLVAVRDTGRTPAETLVSLSHNEVELVLLGGRVQLASDEVKRRVPVKLCDGLQPLSVDGQIRWIRAPLEWLFKETRKQLGEEIYLGGKRVELGSGWKQ
jgi:cytosine/adenosine deaminase-related metal-dependent hydrolase/ubiquinone/menaquinone biosynthesis C-methylase UbiE